MKAFIKPVFFLLEAVFLNCFIKIVIYFLISSSLCHLNCYNVLHIWINFLPVNVPTDKVFNEMYYYKRQNKI